MAFNKTHALIQLAQAGEKDFTSRSEARSFLRGLQSPSHIIVDFKDVSSVGPDFVDELFRVYKLEHSHLSIEPINMNEAIKFMVTRALIGAARYEGPFT